MGMSGGEILDALSSLLPLSGRSEPLRTRLFGKEVLLLRDYYNSNPDSAAAAIELCEAVTGGIKRRVYVLGSMLELGDEAEAAHRALVERARGADLLFLYGKEFGTMNTVFTDMNQLKRALSAELRDGDLVLLKASRGCAFERIEAEADNAA
jgi:UDP-N-acetylmuramoyl-tripeptide--D-alanyl-D-alanine ligase